MAQDLCARLREKKLISIVRGAPTEKITKIADAIYRGGFHFMEITFDQSGKTPHAVTAEQIRIVREAFDGRLHVGAGTVMTEAQLKLAAEAGAGSRVSCASSIYRLMRRRNLHIRADLMVESKLLVNVGSCNLAGCNGADGSRRSRHAVAAGKDGFHVVDLAGAFCHEGSPADGDTGLFKACNLDALTDCHNDDICRDAFFRHIRLLRTGRYPLHGVVGESAAAGAAGHDALLGADHLPAAQGAAVGAVGAPGLYFRLEQRKFEQRHRGHSLSSPILYPLSTDLSTAFFHRPQKNQEEHHPGAPGRPGGQGQTAGEVQGGHRLSLLG